MEAYAFGQQASEMEQSAFLGVICFGAAPFDVLIPAWQVMVLRSRQRPIRAWQQVMVPGWYGGGDRIVGLYPGTAVCPASQIALPLWQAGQLS